MSLDILLVVNTLPSYTNEERSRISFAECLRPIYEILIKEIGKEPAFDMAFVKVSRTYMLRITGTAKQE